MSCPDCLDKDFCQCIKATLRAARKRKQDRLLKQALKAQAAGAILTRSQRGMVVAARLKEANQ